MNLTKKQLSRLIAALTQAAADSIIVRPDWNHNGELSGNQDLLKGFNDRKRIDSLLKLLTNEGKNGKN